MLELPPCTPQAVIGYSASIFVIGFIAGASVVRYVCNRSEKNLYVEVIRFCVISLWIFATAKAAILDVEYPPFFLNLMFGVIAGGLNTGIWNRTIELAKTIRK